MPSSSPWSQLLKKRYALPAEHGAWIWWLGPLAIGSAAAGRLVSDLSWLALEALVLFLLRQPATIWVKAMSGRRPRKEARPAAAWFAVYATLATAMGARLLRSGYWRLLWLALPGIPVFAWHLWLVSRREERGQMGIELVGAGVLALAAPAAYWVNAGADPWLPWLLWGLTWLQTAASIVLVYLRLAQRRWNEAFTPIERLRRGARALFYHAFNLAAASFLVLSGWMPFLVGVAFSVSLLDALAGVLNPPIGHQPARIGLRQLAGSALFTLLMMAAFAIRA